MKSQHIAICSLIFAGLALYAFADSPQTVNLKYATYQGTLNSTSNITSFLGLRYAKPPIGDLRFQAPAPPLTVTVVQLANTQPPACPQGSSGNASSSHFSFGKRETEIEDCLFLNVYVQGEVSPNSRLPVVVWIHGGGYVYGSTTNVNGGDLIRHANGGVIAVEMQYRLGLFGFLAGSETKKRGTLNAGLLDQQLALQWIQEHIHSFGGDPAKVTIWGESAVVHNCIGAGSVLQHVVAHGGNTIPPLFRAAITSSTFLPSQYHYNDPVPEQLYSEAVEQAGCSNTNDTFACLVSADGSLLEAVNSAICSSYFFGTFAFVPVVDGTFIVERPTQTMARGKLNGDVLLGMTNVLEGFAFVSDDITSKMTLPEYVSQLFPGFGEAQVNAAIQHYTNIGLETVFNQAVAVMGESIFICPTYFLLNGFPGPSFKGEFAVPPGTHSSDYYYIFPSSGSPPIPNAQFSASFTGSFLGVVKSLNPNVNPLFPNSITPQWNQYVFGNTEMLFNITQAGEPDIRAFRTDTGLLERCSFWKSVAEYTPQ
ncbi:cephalosporin esterase [Phellopilus nigrolimitatus]|nr:cephalosporin esterase [Phellopilus nigrolimitatus]